VLPLGAADDVVEDGSWHPSPGDLLEILDRRGPRTAATVTVKPQWLGPQDRRQL
jgi:hypothetical protein